MPRKLKLGRTGAKHQKPAEFDAHRQPKAAGAASRAHETLLAALEATHAAISAPSAADAATMPPPPAATSHPPLPANPLNLPSVRDRKRQRSLIERVRKLEADSRQFQEFRHALWERGSNDWCECSALGYFRLEADITLPALFISAMHMRLAAVKVCGSVMMVMGTCHVSAWQVASK